MPDDFVGWWRKSVKCLRPLESAHMETCQPAVDSLHRRRVPAAIELWGRLANLCKLVGDDAQLRLLTVWLRLVMIAYYVGNFKFLNVLPDPNPVERSQVKGALIEYIQGLRENYLPELKDRLKFYALVQQQ